MAIVASLKDDAVDETELKTISTRLFKLINAAAELARLVQDHFGSPELIAPEDKSLVPAVKRQTAKSTTGKKQGSGRQPKQTGKN
jgi:hypothetical protein